MAEMTSFDLLLVAAGVGVAVWTDVIGSADERVDMFENKYARHATRWMIFLSATVLLMVFASFGAGLFIAVSSGSLGVGGTAFFLVILAISLVGVPVVAKIYLDLIRQANRFEGWEELAVGIAITITICLSVIVLVIYVS